MPFFIVQCTDHEGTLEKRLAARPQHLARLSALNEQGRLITAGPLPQNPEDPSQGFLGSLIVVEFASRTELDAWLAEEPYLAAGVYAHVDVKPFIKAFPQG